MIAQIIRGIGFLSFIFYMACDSAVLENPKANEPDDLKGFPPFITPTDSYFDIHIPGNQSIEAGTYELKISGLIENPVSLSLEDLAKLELLEKTVTVECINNPGHGSLLGTATWKGFRIYDLIESLGLQDGAAFVKYLCSDGYFTYNTLEELQKNEVIGALEINGETLPEKYGFPLRIIYPGYYGVRQAAWVLEIQVLDRGIKDFWSETQFEKWKTDAPMTPDCKIFFPSDKNPFNVGGEVRIGGAAFGAKRISQVEVSVDDGASWSAANIVKKLDQEYTWVFWEVSLTPTKAGDLVVLARATDQDGNVQTRYDDDYLDGINDWPSLRLTVR